jgi:serine/threonine-protein kinase
LKIAAGTILAGKYRLEAPVGKGGMGSVWRARHLKLDADVAIKFMDPGITASEPARDRFQREAKASAKIDYLHIVHVHDYGIEGETPYIVMELLRGESLDERLKRQLRLSLGELVPVVAQVCKALRKAHDAGFIHRDLKPGNIFLVRSDDDDELVKLLDFGIAKDTDSAAEGRTKTGDFMGSPHYMSPEQIHDSSSIDARSDLWSLGVILFRAITGVLPFPGEQVGAVIGGVLTAPIPAPSNYLRGLPEGIDAFFQKALSRDRAARFQSAREMADAFAALVGAPALSGAGRRGSSAPWIQREALMGSASASGSGGYRINTPAAAPPPRASDPGSHAGSSHPVLPPPNPPPSGAGSFERRGKTVKMTPYKGPAPDPGPPKDPPAAHPYGSTQPLSDVTQLVAGTLTASPSARHTAARGPNEGLGQSLFAAVRGWPLQKKIAAGGGIAAALLVLLVVAFRSPSAEEGSSLAGASQTAAAAPPTTQASPGTTATAAENAETAPVEVNLSDVPGMPQQPVPSNPNGSPGDEKGRSQLLKPIPAGKARLIIDRQGGSCKVTVNGSPVGSTPVNVIVNPGNFLVFCHVPNGNPIKQSVNVRAGENKNVGFLVTGRVPAIRDPGF